METGIAAPPTQAEKAATPTLKIATIIAAAILLVLLFVWYTNRRKKAEALLTPEEKEEQRLAKKQAFKRTMIVVGCSTAIGFLGDVVMFSIGTSASEGGKFKVSVPKGMALVQVLVLGIVTGFIVDAAMQAIIESQKVFAEKNLDKLVEREVNRIKAGKIPDKAIAEKVEWKTNGQKA